MLQLTRWLWNQSRKTQSSIFIRGVSLALSLGLMAGVIAGLRDSSSFLNDPLKHVLACALAGVVSSGIALFHFGPMVDLRICGVVSFVVGCSSFITSVLVYKSAEVFGLMSTLGAIIALEVLGPVFRGIRPRSLS